MGIEAALLSALSQLLSTTTAQLLGQESSLPASVMFSGLLDCSGSPDECATQAVQLVKSKGYRCLKIKAMNLMLPG